MMKWKIAVLLGAVLMVIGQAAAQEQTTFEYENISFSYPSDLTIGVEAIEYSELVPQLSDSPFSITPAYTEFFLADYNNNAEAFHEPRILIYPTYNFETFQNNDFPVFTINGQRTMLQTILADTPELNDYVPPLIGESDPFEILPMLPIFNAVQVFRSQPEYVDFQNGSGIRYITYYSQAINPIIDSELFYTFQGLTDDSAYYIAAILPIQSGVLPTVIDDGFDIDAFSATYTDYISELVNTLDGLEGEAFSPSLETLDGVITSLFIDEAQPED